MITSTSRGHEIYFDEENKVWRYRDNNEVIREDRECKRCGRKPTKEGYDACKGYIEGAKSVCCGHGVTKPIEIKEDNYLTWLKNKIEESKELEKCLEENIKTFKDDETLRALWMVNRSYIRLLENIEKEESSKMKKDEIKEVKEGEVNSMENMETKNKCTLSFEEDIKLQEEKIAGLVNLITDYAIENDMSVELVDISFEHVRRVYYKNALIKR